MIPTYRQFVRYVNTISLGHRYFARGRSLTDDYAAFTQELELNLPPAQDFLRELTVYLVKERLDVFPKL
jgi:hypothetical protein